MDLLREHNITVDGKLVSSEECKSLNYVFFNYIKEKKPYVILKYAQSLDGKIATHTGLSQWITGETARNKVHMDRHRYSAVMVGVETVIKDNSRYDYLLRWSTKIVKPHSAQHAFLPINLIHKLVFRFLLFVKQLHILVRLLYKNNSAV